MPTSFGILPVKKLYCTWNDMSSGQLVNNTEGISPVSPFISSPNSRIAHIPANAGGKPPERWFTDISRKVRFLRFPSSGGRVETSPAFFILSRCSIWSWPRTGGIAPPSWLSPSSRILNCDIDPRNSGTPPVRLLAAISRSWSFVNLLSDAGIRPENSLLDKFRYIRFGSFSGSVSGISPNRVFCDKSR
ncbi:Os10g0469100 [Oryza sativa Japonica Group]|uniref:Os10g0469100 protein n=2 Tax=Oryza sativa subsp. japonica TaxID=39947 RepID=Q0IX33_ORYSJ|nr:hypothetical protein EE612_051764 [Oryza sativa]KAB8112955.1 hypothetical protein EE612_051764 [Oryza sativa]BAF26732.1 Os10g0469100 [Oryza sativa Japonica Group]BAT11242.1 Os10g0469100 [Oryza sativa Japonica Group]|eukprot:NP_001064818.1 Os10g0469100 [Oryza sativa Japonica Group]